MDGGDVMTWATESFVSQALAQYLQAQGQGTYGTNIFADFMPESPDTLTSLTQYGGAPPPHIMMSGQYSSSARIQLHSRAGADDADAARTRIWDAYSTLLAITELQQGAVRIINVSPAADPELLEHDDRHRVLFVANLDVTYGLV